MLNTTYTIYFWLSAYEKFAIDVSKWFSLTCLYLWAKYLFLKFPAKNFKCAKKKCSIFKLKVFLNSTFVTFASLLKLYLYMCRYYTTYSPRQKYFKQKLQLRSAYHMILHQNESTKNCFSHFGRLNATIKICPACLG